jgi:hypothetical protein
MNTIPLTTSSAPIHTSTTVTSVCGRGLPISAQLLAASTAPLSRRLLVTAFGRCEHLTAAGSVIFLGVRVKH